MENKSIISPEIGYALAKAARWLDAHIQSKSFDEATVRQAVGNVYRAFGLREPEIWLAFDSPLEAAAFISLLDKHVPLAGRHLSYYINKRMTDALKKNIDSCFQRSFRKEAQRGIQDSAEIQQSKNIIRDILEHLPSRTSAIAGWHHVRKHFIHQVEQQTRLCAKPGFTVSKHAALVELSIRAALLAVVQGNSLWDMKWFFWILRYNRAATHWRNTKLEYLVLKHARSKRNCRNDFGNKMAYSILEADFLCDWLAFEHVAIVIRRPTEAHYETDTLFGLHNESGPALAYANGMKLYYSHGASLPGWLFEKPELLTPLDICSLYDSEARSFMIRRYGVERFLRDVQAPVVSSDEYGRLFKVTFKHGQPFAAVMVRNSTPEADGTHKYHYLFVPPEMRTAHEAVAWTFGLSANEYSLVEES